jgi:uncharacterized protein (TIGR02145 family)
LGCSLNNWKRYSVKDLQDYVWATLAVVLAIFALTACDEKGGNTFTDSRDGKTYKTVKIGEQVWLAENLNYEAKGSLCYDNKKENCDKYGRLYDWNTAKAACPSSWHLSSNEEWDKLYRFAGGKRDIDFSEEKDTISKRLKAKSGWSGNGNGTDDFGFSALPGGYRHNQAGFIQVGNYSLWWITTNKGNEFHHILYDGGLPSWDGYDYSYLFSVRCVRD